MERNTVCLDLKDYEDLRKCKEAMMQERIYAELHEQGPFCRTSINLYTKDDAVKLLADANKSISEELKKLQTEKFNSQAPSLQIDLKNMTIWQFLKQKRK